MHKLDLDIDRFLADKNLELNQVMDMNPEELKAYFTDLQKTNEEDDNLTVTTEEMTEEDDDDSWCDEQYELSIPVPKAQYDFRHDRFPCTMLVAGSINKQPATRVLQVLFDSGGTGCMIHRSALPRGCTPTRLQQPIKTKTLKGEFTSHTYVMLRDMVLPEFDRNRRIDEQPAYIFDGPSRYDVILGRDFLRRIGIKLDFHSNLMQWMDLTVPMKDNSYWEEPAQMMFAQDDDEADLEQRLETMATEILDAKYEKVDPSEVAAKQTHLTAQQRKELGMLLSKFGKLFDGQLGLYPHKQVHLEVDPNATPVHSRAYSVPKAHEQVFRRELRHLVDIGVLSPVGATQWAAPTFIIPKVCRRT